MSWGAAAPIHSNVAAPVIGDSTMPSRFPLWSCRVLVLAASASPLLGCKKAGSASGDSRVEMSDARLTVLAPQKYRLAVKYRFVQGKPGEQTEGACNADIRYGQKSQGGLVILFQGNQGSIQPEGTLHGEFAVTWPFQPGDLISYEVLMTEGLPGSPHTRISNVLRGYVVWDGNFGN